MIEIRRLSGPGIELAFEVIAELRTHLDRSEFLRRVELQSPSGYELWGAVEGGRVIGAVGFRPAHSLARGLYLHVDDLVVTAGRRGQGIGRMLLVAAEREAQRLGCASVFLDSRPAALRFYQDLGYALHPSPLVHKPVP